MIYVSKYMRSQLLIAVTMNITVVLDVTLCSLITNYRCFRGMLKLLTRYSEMSVNICQTTRRHIQEDTNLPLIKFSTLLLWNNLIIQSSVT
jgi:predicted signal transduction protein with EAL and GGDEF domain